MTTLIDQQQRVIASQTKLIQTALKKAGYTTRQLTNQHAIEITGKGEDTTHFVLSYLPRPVNQWALLPPGQSQSHRNMYTLIDQAINAPRRV